MTPRRSSCCEIAVIGAGPYGLSVAAHLKHAGIAAKVFGEPMAFWRRNMPKGMLLRSPWRATHLSDPDGALSLDAYATAHNIDSSKLLPLEQFVAYGTWFQQQTVADVERRNVRVVNATGPGFELILDDGETFSADRVVVATGLRNQEYVPPAFRELPAALVSHSSAHADFSALRGQRVAVIGAGQSACESAALLAEAGAYPELFTREAIHWLGDPMNSGSEATVARRLRRMLRSPSEVGPFPLSWLVELPGWVRHLPARSRDEFIRRCLKPAAAGWLKPRLAGMPCASADAITGVRALRDRVVLDFANGAQTYNHVVLGTGYQVDIARLELFAPALLDKIARIDGSPLLGRGFESSVAKLHFVGSYAVKSFGPLLRFIAGAPFAARAVTVAARRGAARRSSLDLSRPVPAFDTAAPNLSPPR